MPSAPPSPPAGACRGVCVCVWGGCQCRGRGVCSARAARLHAADHTASKQGRRAGRQPRQCMARGPGSQVADDHIRIKLIRTAHKQAWELTDGAAKLAVDDDFFFNQSSTEARRGSSLMEPPNSQLMKVTSTGPNTSTAPPKPILELPFMKRRFLKVTCRLAGWWWRLGILVVCGMRVGSWGRGFRSEGWDGWAGAARCARHPGRATQGVWPPRCSLLALLAPRACLSTARP